MNFAGSKKDQLLLSNYVLSIDKDNYILLQQESARNSCKLSRINSTLRNGLPDDPKNKRSDCPPAVRWKISSSNQKLHRCNSNTTL